MNTPIAQSIFNAVNHAGVVQDKATPQRIYKASGEASYSSPPAHPRPKHHGSQKRKLVEVSGCVPQSTFAEIERMRDQWAKNQGKTERLSRSEVVGSLVKRGVQGNIDMQYGSMLAPVIRNEIKKDFGGYANHTAFLSKQAYYKAAEANYKLDELFRYILKDPQELHEIQRKAKDYAGDSLKRKTEE